MTPEEKWDQDTDTYNRVWEQHDLGLHPDLQAAYSAANDWRESVKGLYGS